MSKAKAEAAAKALTDLTGESLQLLVTSGEHKKREARVVALTETARERFRGCAQDVAKRLVNVQYLPYQATYKPEPHQREYAALTSFSQVKAAADDANSPAGLKKFDPSDESFKKDLRYSTVVAEKDGKKIYLLRRFTQTNELKRKKGVDLLYADAKFTVPEDHLFHFDGAADCIVYDDTVIVVRKQDFRQVFDEMGDVFAKAIKAAKKVHEQLPIKNYAEFEAAIGSQGSLADKLLSIADSPYLEGLTMDAVEKTNTDYNLKVTFEGPTGKREMVFGTTPQERFRILQLLDDDALRSDMTEGRYLVNSKRRR